MRMFVRLVVSAAVLAGLGVVAHADTVTIQSSGAARVTISPSSDVVTLYSGAVATDVPGTVAFELGIAQDFDSPIKDQVIPFSITDAITISGVTQNVVLQGEDEVTTGPDTISFLEGPVYQFGDVRFHIDGETLPALREVDNSEYFTLDGSVSQTPEPSALLLMGTGIAGSAGMLRRRFLRA